MLLLQVRRQEQSIMGTAESSTELPSRLHAAAPYLIEQDFSAYTPDQHTVWAELVSRRMPQLGRHACQEYLDGFEQIGLREDHLPDLKAISARLQPRTGWSSTPVSGFLPPGAFFEMLSRKMFPTTTWLRDRDSLEYTPEPDIFHDVFGHVPMHAHPVFGDFLQHYGQICAGLIDNPVALERMGRVFWFTVEFGVIRQNGDLKVYGSGLISSHGECTRVLAGECEVRNFDLEAVMNQEFDTGAMQPVLYAVDSFDQIYEATKMAEARLK
jgi:phenylalanine-4-hydroxylase